MIHLPAKPASSRAEILSLASLQDRGKKEAKRVSQSSFYVLLTRPSLSDVLLKLNVSHTLPPTIM